VNRGEWVAIDGVLVDPHRGPHFWGEGGDDAYCCECEAKAGTAMRAQMAREEAEKDSLGISPPRPSPVSAGAAQVAEVAPTRSDERMR
jgi:hypothetical protein